MKTVRWRHQEAPHFALCEECWEPISGVLWILRGPVPAHGFCPSCSEWFSVRELSELSPAGWKWDSPAGLCPNCTKEER
jgi:hypothetical protein